MYAEIYLFGVGGSGSGVGGDCVVMGGGWGEEGWW
jgi:hypothetical protein